MILKRLFGELFIYAFANALNRGTLLLISPILLTTYSVEEVGKFSVTYAISQFIMPIVALGMTSAIVREGVSDKSVNNYLTFYSILMSVILGFGLAIVTFIFDNNEIWNLKYAICIGTANTVIELLLASFRTSNEKMKFAALCFLKSVSILIATFISIYNSYDVERLFITILISLVVVVIVSLWKISDRFISINNNIRLRSCLSYSIFMVPHAISVWAISSIDKVIIDYTSSDYDLGIYSISYTVAMVFLIVNSGISLALPQYVFSNVAHYYERNVRNKVVKYYTIFYAVLIFLMEFLVFIDSRITRILPDDEMFYIIYRIVIFGIYLSGIYQFYSLFLVYSRSTKILSKISFVIAFANISLNLLLIPNYGILAAAWVTTISYLLYWYVIYISVCNEYPDISETRFVHLLDMTKYSLGIAALLATNFFLFPKPI